MKIALYGGSFNPPHVGHLLVISYVLATADVDELWLMPAYRHAFGKALVPFANRIEMCRLLTSFFAGGVGVTGVEAELAGSGRTLDTLEHLQANNPDASFRLVVGSDILEEAASWHAFDEVEERAPLLIVARSGHPHPRASGPWMPAISSTEVRDRLASGVGAERLVPRVILDYIRSRGLYR